MTVVNFPSSQAASGVAVSYRVIQDFPAVGFNAIRLARATSHVPHRANGYAVLYICPPWAEEWWDEIAVFEDSEAGLASARLGAEIAHRALSKVDLFSWDGGHGIWEGEDIDRAVEKAKEMLGIGPDQEVYLRYLLGKGDKE